MADTLVTGATGLVGYNIVQALLRQGREVRALVRSREKGSRLLPAEVELADGDVRDKESVQRAMAGCVSAFHVAGLPEQWLPDIRLFHRVNVLGTQNMVEAALANEVKKFVYVSTVDVFAANREHEFDERHLDPQPKQTPYGRSKQEADRQVAQACSAGLPAVFIHPAAVYGPGPAGSPGLNDFINRLAARKVPMVPPGILPVVFAPDLADACTAAEQMAAAGQRFIACESCQTFREISRVTAGQLDLDRIPWEMPLWAAKLIAATSEWVANVIKKPPLIHAGQLHTLQSGAFPCSDKARRELDWEPKSFSEGVEQTCQFLFPERAAGIERSVGRC